MYVKSQQDHGTTFICPKGCHYTSDRRYPYCLDSKGNPCKINYYWVTDTSKDTSKGSTDQGKWEYKCIRSGPINHNLILKDGYKKFIKKINSSENNFKIAFLGVHRFSLKPDPIYPQIEGEDQMDISKKVESPTKSSMDITIEYQLYNSSGPVAPSNVLTFIYQNLLANCFKTVQNIPPDYNLFLMYKGSLTGDLSKSICAVLTYNQGFEMIFYPPLKFNIDYSIWNVCKNFVLNESNACQQLISNFINNTIGQNNTYALIVDPDNFWRY